MYTLAIFFLWFEFATISSNSLPFVSENITELTWRPIDDAKCSYTENTSLSSRQIIIFQYSHENIALHDFNMKAASSVATYAQNNNYTYFYVRWDYLVYRNDSCALYHCVSSNIEEQVTNKLKVDRTHSLFRRLGKIITDKSKKSKQKINSAILYILYTF